MMMARLIDADKLLEIYKKWIPQLSSKEDEGDRRGVETCIVVLEDMPTMDAVEVVRCKDCLYSRERYGHIECIHGVSYRNTWNKPDFYCSYGERKDGEAE